MANFVSDQGGGSSPGGGCARSAVWPPSHQGCRDTRLFATTSAHGGFSPSCPVRGTRAAGVATIGRYEVSMLTSEPQAGRRKDLPGDGNPPPRRPLLPVLWTCPHVSPKANDHRATMRRCTVSIPLTLPSAAIPQSALADLPRGVFAVLCSILAESFLTPRPSSTGSPLTPSTPPWRHGFSRRRRGLDAPSSVAWRCLLGKQ